MENNTTQPISAQPTFGRPQPYLLSRSVAALLATSSLLSFTTQAAERALPPEKAKAHADSPGVRKKASPGAAVEPDSGTDGKSGAEPAPWQFVNFQATNISYLYGFNWDTPFSASKERDIITLEHFNDNKIGDFYFFVDFANLVTKERGAFPETGLDIYGEISPRLSFNKIFGHPMGKGIIKDFLFYSGTLELGTSGSLDNINKAFGTNIETSHKAQLHGAAVDFNIPGFAYAQLNAYWRDDFDQNGSTWQVTTVWGVPFEIGGLNFIFKGFADLNGKEGDLTWTFHTSPQLVMDLGQALFKKKDILLIGTEVDIWVNEFGVKSQDDFVPQAMVQFYF